VQGVADFVRRADFEKGRMDRIYRIYRKMKAG